MNSITKDGGGSFKELRERHLPLFDLANGRHDRGWPHRPEEKRKGSAKMRLKPAKRLWKNVGIFHFPAHHDED